MCMQNLKKIKMSLLCFHEHDKFSKCTKYEDSNLKNDPMTAKNAEITNCGIMRIFNEVT